MAIKMIAGFANLGDNNDTTTARTVLTNKGWLQITSGSVDTDTTLNGRASWRMTSGSLLRWLDTDDLDELIVGFAYNDTGVGGGSVQKILYLEYNDGVTGNVQAYLQKNTDGSYELVNGDTTSIVSSAAGVHISDAWNILQLRVKIHNTTGTARLVRGITELFNATGLDTQNHASAIWNQVRFSEDNNEWNLAGVFAADTTGSAPENDILTFVPAVTTLLPNGNGGTNDFTPVGSATNFENVDEVKPDNTDYNHSATSTDREEYALEDMPANTGTIVAAKYNAQVVQPVAGSSSIKVGHRESATDALSAVQNVDTSETYYSHINHDKASTGPQTETTMNATELVVELQ